MAVVRVRLTQEGIICDGIFFFVHDKFPRVATVEWYLSQWHVSTLFQYELLSQINPLLDSIVIQTGIQNLSNIRLYLIDFIGQAFFIFIKNLHRN